MNPGIIALIIILILGVALVLIYFLVIRPRSHHVTPVTPVTPIVPLVPPVSPAAPVAPVAPAAPTAPTAPTPSSCPQFSRMINRDIPGFNMPNMPTSGKETDCQTLCTSTPNCNWYNYSDISNQCWLKQGATYSNDLVTGFRIEDNPPNNTTCPSWYRIVGVDITGFDMSNLSGYPFTNQTEEQCQQLCINNDCDWYNYNTSDSVCYLKLANTTSGIITGLPVTQSSPLST